MWVTWSYKAPRSILILREELHSMSGDLQPAKLDKHPQEC